MITILRPQLFTDHICNFILDLYFFQFFLCCIHMLLPDPDRNYEQLSSTLLFLLPRSPARPSMLAVKFTSTILGNACFIILFTTSPSSVTYRFLFSFATYRLADNRSNGRRIGTWTSDSQFFQRLYKGSLCIMSRRLCKMLLWLQFL